MRLAPVIVFRISDTGLSQRFDRSPILQAILTSKRNAPIPYSFGSLSEYRFIVPSDVRLDTGAPGTGCSARIQRDGGRAPVTARRTELPSRRGPRLERSLATQNRACRGDAVYASRRDGATKRIAAGGTSVTDFCAGLS